MLSKITLPQYLEGRHVSIGKPEVSGTPGWANLTPQELDIYERIFEKTSTQYTNDQWIFHGTNLENAYKIFQTKEFIPLVRRGMEEDAGLYLGCRGIAEYFALHSALNNGNPFSWKRDRLFIDPKHNPALIAFKRDEIDEYFSEQLHYDGISDVNPPSEVLWKNRVVDLYTDCPKDKKERTKFYYEKSGTVYIKSKDPLDISKLNFTVITTNNITYQH